MIGGCKQNEGRLLMNNDKTKQSLAEISARKKNEYARR